MIFYRVQKNDIDPALVLSKPVFIYSSYDCLNRTAFTDTGLLDSFRFSFFPLTF